MNDRIKTSRPKAARAGSVLLEAVIGLAVLSFVAGTSLWLASDALYAFRRASESEARVREAQRLVTAVSLWPQSDLDRRLGTTVQGSWRLMIQRPVEGLYEIAVADSAGGQAILRTAVLRHE